MFSVVVPYGCCWLRVFPFSYQSNLLDILMSPEVCFSGNLVDTQFSLFLWLPSQNPQHTFLPWEGREGGRRGESKEDAAVLVCSQHLNVLKFESWCVFVFLPGYPLQKHKVHKIVEYYHSPLVVLNFSVLINLKIALYSSLCPHPGVGSMHRNQASGNVFLC